MSAGPRTRRRRRKRRRRRGKGDKEGGRRLTEDGEDDLASRYGG